MAAAYAAAGVVDRPPGSRTASAARTGVKASGAAPAAIARDADSHACHAHDAVASVAQAGSAV